MKTGNHRPTEPLATTTMVFGLLLAAALALAVVATIFGSGSIGEFGHADVCATNSHELIGGFPAQHLGIATRPGAYLNLSAPVEACTRRPSMGQSILYTLTSLPSLLAWAGVLLLLWRLVAVAERSGPFTPQVAAAMRHLGWFILGATTLATATQGFATDQLLNTLLVQHSSLGDTIGAPVHALLPTPALAAAGLLTFARIIRLGTAMDDEIRGTV
jgi:hypothetical protein